MSSKMVKDLEALFGAAKDVATGSKTLLDIVMGDEPAKTEDKAPDTITVHRDGCLLDSAHKGDCFGEHGRLT